MIKNNLILELMKVELKKGSIAEKRYVIHGNGKDRGKVFEDELWVNIKLDVSTFDEELIQEHLTALIHYKRRHMKIGKSEVYCGLIGSSEYNVTNGKVLLSMLKCDYEDLNSSVQDKIFLQTQLDKTKDALTQNQ